jgi:hypothetical protein
MAQRTALFEPKPPGAKLHRLAGIEQWFAGQSP